MKRVIPAIIFLTMFAAPARAAGSSQHVQYELYAAGLNAVTATLDVKEGDGHYSAHLVAKTQGLLGKLAQWEGTFLTEGKTGKPLRPLHHKSVAHSGKDIDIDDYRYGPDGAFQGYEGTKNGKRENATQPDAKLTKGTIDALTAAFAVMNKVADGTPCAGVSEIFDGERRYRLTFRDLGTETLPDSRYSLYRGLATKCSAEVTPLSGKWHAKPRGWLSIQEQGRKRGQLPLIWLAKVERGAPAIPVKVKVVTDYGTLYMHVASYANDRGVKLDQESK